LLHRVLLDYAVRYGRVMGSDQERAVAIWLAPDHHIRAAGMIRCGILEVPWRIGLGQFARLVRSHAVMERFRKEYLPEPHWQLRVLGVLPGWQRRGLGSALVREGLARADRDFRPCYVETCDERNLAFYRRHGFRVLGSAPLGPGGPAGWALRRDAPRAL
jgi:ribosomal protein S18 acetylase RimI-like enzyme